MTNPPLNEPQQRDDPSPSLQGLYENPDGTYETGNIDEPAPLPETGVMQHRHRDPADEDAFPQPTMDSNAANQRRADTLEPAAHYPNRPVAGTPQAAQSDQLAEQPIIQAND